MQVIRKQRRWSALSVSGSFPVPTSVPVPSSSPVLPSTLISTQIKSKPKIPILPFSVPPSPSHSHSNTPSSSRPASTFTTPRISPRIPTTQVKVDPDSLISSFLSSTQQKIKKSSSTSPTVPQQIPLQSTSSSLIPPAPVPKPSRRRSSPKTPSSPRNLPLCLPPNRTPRQKELLRLQAKEQIKEVTRERTRVRIDETMGASSASLTREEILRKNINLPSDGNSVLTDENISQQIIYYREKKNVLDLWNT